MSLYSWAYRSFMTVTHHFNWHHAPVIGPILPDGDYQRWCKWCGFRQSFQVVYQTEETRRRGEINGIRRFHGRR